MKPGDFAKADSKNLLDQDMGSHDEDDEIDLGSDSDEDESSEEDDSNSSSEDDANIIDEVMLKDFIAMTPTDEDLPGIEALIKQLLKNFNLDLKELASILVEQNYVTTVLKAEELDEFGTNMTDPEEDSNVVYGVYSAINLKTRKNNSAVKKLMDVLLKHSKNSSCGSFVEKLLSEDDFSPAFLIKEKMINVPGVASAPCMMQLRTDLRNAVENKMPYNFTHYFHVAKMVKLSKGKNDSYFADQDDELMDLSNSGYFDMQYDSALDSKVKFQNDCGKPLVGKMYRRVYIFSNDDLTCYFDAMNEMQGVKQVVAAAQSTGLIV